MTKKNRPSITLDADLVPSDGPATPPINGARRKRIAVAVGAVIALFLGSIGAYFSTPATIALVDSVGGCTLDPTKWSAAEHIGHGLKVLGIGIPAAAVTAGYYFAWFVVQRQWSNRSRPSPVELSEGRQKWGAAFAILNTARADQKYGSAQAAARGFVLGWLAHSAFRLVSIIAMIGVFLSALAFPLVVVSEVTRLAFCPTAPGFVERAKSTPQQAISGGAEITLHSGIARTPESPPSAEASPAFSQSEPVVIAPAAPASVASSAAIHRPPTAQPSFDCALASSAVETLICRNEALSKADVQLSREFNSLLTVHQQQGSSDAVANEQSSQRIWLRKRDECAEAACIAALYKERIEYFQAQQEKLQAAPLDSPG